MKRIGKWGVKKVLIAVAIIICLWLLMGTIDFLRVHCFERPIFCIISPEATCDDGGSGTYVGLGYAFDIEGNFMPDGVSEGEQLGVTKYTARIFNTPVMAGVRD